MIQSSSFIKRFFKEILIFFKIGIFTCTIFYLIPVCIYAYTQGGSSSLSVETYTLTNGDKTLVFQSMYHIGLRSFYQKVGEEMTDYRNKGYRVFLEGIGSTGYKPLRKNDDGYEQAVDNYKKLYKDKWSKMLDDMNDKSAFKISKYTYQSIDLTRYIAYDDEYADLSYITIDQLIDDKAKIAGMDSSFVLNYKETRTDYSYSSSVDMLKNNERLYIFLKNVENYPLFSFLDKITLPLLGYFSPTIKLNKEITINSRDKNLVEHILNEPEKLVYVTYGADHFDGVFKGLKEIDSRWKIVKTTKKNVFSVY